jgi:hypothetical protein
MAKHQVRKGQRVLIKIKTPNGFSLKEGTIVDAVGTALLVEFRFWIFSRKKWIDFQEGSKFSVTLFE